MGLFPETPKSVIRRIADLRDGVDESAWERFAELYRPAIREFIRISSPALRRPTLRTSRKTFLLDWSRSSTRGHMIRQRGSFAPIFRQSLGGFSLIEPVGRRFGSRLVAPCRLRRPRGRRRKRPTRRFWRISTGESPGIRRPLRMSSRSQHWANRHGASMS